METVWKLFLYILPCNIPTMESTVKGWLSLFTAATFYPRKRERKRVSRGGLWLSAGISKKGGLGVGKYEGRIQISLLRRRTRGGIEKVFGTRQQETSKSVPFPPAEYKWNVLRTGDCIVFLSIHTNLHERYSCWIKKKKGKRKDCCVPWMNTRQESYIAKIEFQKRACKILQVLGVWLFLFYFNLIWVRKEII